MLEIIVAVADIGGEVRHTELLAEIQTDAVRSPVEIVSDRKPTLRPAVDAEQQLLHHQGLKLGATAAGTLALGINRLAEPEYRPVGVVVKDRAFKSRVAPENTKEN